MFIWITFGTYQGIKFGYPNTIPMLKCYSLCRADVVWACPAWWGKRGFNKPFWNLEVLNGVQRIPVEARRVWWGERWLLLFVGKIFFYETKYFFCIFLLYALHTEYLKNEELQYITILSYE